MKIKHLKVLLYILFIFTTQVSVSQSLKFDWVKTMPVVSNYGNLLIRATDTDSNGNIYSVLRFNGTIDINPQQGTSPHSTISTLDNDLIIQKIDSSGTLIWAKQIGNLSTHRLYAMDIKLDGFGNTYVLGQYNDTVDFDPGSGTFILDSIGGTKDIFILKLDNNGDFVWAKSLIGPGIDRGSALDIDEANNIYISGSFQDSLDFDPGVDTLYKQANGSRDFFILKLNSDGSFNWVNTYGGPFSDFCYDIKVDNQANIILTGTYRNQTFFDPNDTLQLLTGTQYHNLFILKLDSTGSFIWVKGTPPSNNIIGGSISLDSYGNIYISGTFDEHANFDTATSSSLYTSNRMAIDKHDAYLLKLNSNGEYIWVKGFQGNDVSFISDILFGSNNKLILLVDFTHSVDVDPSANNYIITGNGHHNMIVQQLDSAGNFIWASSYISTISCFGKPILLSQNEDLFIGGYFQGSIDFDENTNATTQTSLNGISSFFLKLKPCLHPSMATTLTVTACNSYTWTNGITYTSSTNQIRHVFSNVSGCDSLVTLGLTILKPGVSYGTVVTCDSITWIDGNTYYQSNDSAAIITIANASSNGCDSLVILNLINQSNGSTFNEDACNEYTWLNGVTYFSITNTPEMIYTNVNGCDSVVRLNLRLFPYDTTIIQTDAMTLFATYTQGMHYQWYSCDGDSILPGKTYPSFKAQVPGSYALIFSRPYRCSDTSSCYYLNPLGINKLESDELINIYPNPTKDFISIDFQKVIAKNALVVITDLSGQLVYQKLIQQKTSTWVEKIDLTKLVSGLYFLKVTINRKDYTFKISKL